MTREESLDLGQRTFVFAISAVLAVSALLTILVLGLDYTLLAVLLGAISTVVPIVMAEGLYSGKPGARTLVRGWLALHAVLLLLFVFLALSGSGVPGLLPGTTGLWLLAALSASHVLLCLIVAGRGPVSVFLGARRGEVVEAAPAGKVPASPATFFVARDNKHVLSEPARGSVKKTSLISRVVGGLLLLVSVGAIVLAVLCLITPECQTDWLALLLTGAITHVLGMVLLATGADLDFLGSTEGYEANHLANTLTSLRAFFNFQVGLAVLILGVLLISWMTG